MNLAWEIQYFQWKREVSMLFFPLFLFFGWKVICSWFYYWLSFSLCSIFEWSIKSKKKVKASLKTTAVTSQSSNWCHVIRFLTSPGTKIKLTRLIQILKMLTMYFMLHDFLNLSFDMIKCFFQHFKRHFNFFRLCILSHETDTPNATSGGSQTTSDFQLVSGMKKQTKLTSILFSVNSEVFIQSLSNPQNSKSKWAERATLRCNFLNIWIFPPKIC